MWDAIGIENVPLGNNLKGRILRLGGAEVRGSVAVGSGGARWASLVGARAARPLAQQPLTARLGRPGRGATAGWGQQVGIRAVVGLRAALLGLAPFVGTQLVGTGEIGYLRHRIAEDDSRGFESGIGRVAEASVLRLDGPTRG